MAIFATFVSSKSARLDTFLATSRNYEGFLGVCFKKCPGAHKLVVFSFFLS